jgi:hypothetical protein
MSSRLIYIFFLLFLTVQLNAQYENGYIVTIDGENIMGLLKNENWTYSPDKIKFKKNIASSEQVFEIENLKEFGFGEKEKFVVAKVNLEISSDIIGRLSNKKAPLYEKRTLALKKLVDGYISLYEYTSSNMVRYYAKTSEQDFEPLIFKKYRVSENRIGINEHYKQQLSLLMRDYDFSKQITRLSYSAKNISKLVSEYNTFKYGKSQSYIQKRNGKTALKLNIIAGLEQTSVTYELSREPITFSDISRSMIGGELELLFFNESLGFFTGYTVKSEVSRNTDVFNRIFQRDERLDFTYNNNTLAIGIRGYIKTIKNVKLILTAGITREYVSNFSLQFELRETDQFRRNAGYEFFGLGLQYKKLFIEARFFNNKMFVENVAVGTPEENSNINFRLGYKIF